MIRTAEDICNDPPSEVFDAIAEVGEVAKQTQSQAFRFALADDGTKYEIRVWPDEAYTLTPVDDAGRPLGDPVAPGGSTPYIYGQDVQPATKTLRGQIRVEEQARLALRAAALEAEAAKQAKPTPEPEPEPEPEPQPQPVFDQDQPKRTKVGAFFLGPKR